jgi:hypothetical protein
MTLSSLSSLSSHSALTEAIAECLSLHAECQAKLGTDLPEELPQIAPAFRDKIIRQRERVNATLTGVSPEVHVQQIQSLNKGLRLILAKLAPRPVEPPPPPQPVWDDQSKVWKVMASEQERDAYVATLAKRFDERGPDSIDDLFPVKENA